MPDLKLGSTLLIKPASSLENNPELELTSTFETMLPNNHVLFTTPIHKGVLYTLSIGDTLFVYFTDQNGRYDFQCLVVERLVQNSVHFIKARLLSEIALSQRRNYFRIKAALKGKVIIERVIEDHEEQKVRKIVSHCLTHDISGGGVALYTNGIFEKGDIVTVVLPVGANGDPVELGSRIVWINDCDHGNYSFFIGMEFIYDGKNQREDMVKYVFQLQYEMLRQKRLGIEED